jgi:hypothetical protein
MADTTSQITPGFPEMWQPVYEKYRVFFLCADKLMPVVNEVMRAPINGMLLNISHRMVIAASNSYGALLTLVLNGYGHDAMKIARSLFEIELNILRLKAKPEEISDFVDYNFIQQKQLYDLMDETQKAQVPKEQYDELMKKYNEVLPRFAGKRDKNTLRNEWCRDSIYARATQAGPEYLELYRTFYRQASSMHHLDIAGVISCSDADLYADVAPSWALLDDALVATGCFIRSIGYYDEMASLGLKERLENEVNQDYEAAVRSLLPDVS